MNVDAEDTTSLHGGASDVGSEAAGGVSLAESTLTVPEENKNGVSNSSSESGLEVDRLSLGHGSGASESEKLFEPTEMVRLEKKNKCLRLENRYMCYLTFAHCLNIFANKLSVFYYP